MSKLQQMFERYEVGRAIEKYNSDPDFKKLADEIARLIGSVGLTEEDAADLVRAAIVANDKK